MAWATISNITKEQELMAREVTSMLQTAITVYKKQVRIRLPLDLEEREIAYQVFDDLGFDYKLSGVLT